MENVLESSLKITTIFLTRLYFEGYFWYLEKYKQKNVRLTVFSGKYPSSSTFLKQNLHY